MLRLLPFRFGASVFARSRSCKQLTQLAELPVKLEHLLSDSDGIEDLSKEFFRSTDFLYLGRGINFQVQVGDCEPALERLALAGWPLFAEPEETWYRVGDAETGARQFLVQDPDGYLVRVASPLGERKRSRSALQ